MDHDIWEHFNVNDYNNAKSRIDNLNNEIDRLNKEAIWWSDMAAIEAQVAAVAACAAQYICAAAVVNPLLIGPCAAAQATAYTAALASGWHWLVSGNLAREALNKGKERDRAQEDLDSGVGIGKEQSEVTRTRQGAFSPFDEEDAYQWTTAGVVPNCCCMLPGFLADAYPGCFKAPAPPRTAIFTSKPQ